VKDLVEEAHVLGVHQLEVVVEKSDDADVDRRSL
jgi:hypothetical protein